MGGEPLPGRFMLRSADFNNEMSAADQIAACPGEEAIKGLKASRPAIQRQHGLIQPVFANRKLRRVDAHRDSAHA